MSKRKFISESHSANGYKQTCISNYFKVTSMSSRSVSLNANKRNKKDDSEESIKFLKKKLKPLSSDSCDKENDSADTVMFLNKKIRSISTSDDESQTTDADKESVLSCSKESVLSLNRKQSHITTSDDESQTVNYNRDNVIRANKITLREVMLSKLEKRLKSDELPRYVDSETEDSDNILDDTKVPLLMAEFENKFRQIITLNKSKTILSEDTILIVSSDDDDDDFEETPRRTRKLEPVSRCKLDFKNNNTSKDYSVGSTSSGTTTPCASPTKTSIRIGAYKPRITTSLQKDTKPHILKTTSYSLSETSTAVTTTPCATPTKTSSRTGTCKSKVKTSLKKNTKSCILKTTSGNLSETPTAGTTTPCESPSKKSGKIGACKLKVRTSLQKNTRACTLKTTSDSLSQTPTSGTTTPSASSSSTNRVYKPRVTTSRQKKTKPCILKTTSDNLSHTPTASISNKASVGTEENVKSARSDTSPNKAKILQNIVLNSPSKSTAGNDKVEKPSSSVKKEILNSPSKSPQSRKLFSKLRLKATKLDLSNSDNAGEEEQWNPIATRLFKKIERYVTEHDHLKELLTIEETYQLRKFNGMKCEENRYLCLKLYTRIQKWYNIFKLRDALKIKVSDPDVVAMYECLSRNGFVETDFSQEPCVDLLNNLLNKDLKDLCDNFKLKGCKKRSEYIQALLKNCNKQMTLTFTKSTEEILRERIKDKMGYCVKLHPSLYKLFNKLHLLYTFTTSDFNNTSDLYLFLSRIEYKDIIMPKYKINTDLRVFQSELEFSRFMKAYECKSAILNCIDKKEISNTLELCQMAFSELKALINTGIETLRTSYMMRFTSGHKYVRALSAGAKYLARYYPKEVEGWLIFLIEQDRYTVQMRGTWYDLLVMIQHNYLKEIETAAKTVIEALQRKDLSQVNYHELSQRAEMIKQYKSRPISELYRNDIARVQVKPVVECGSIEISGQHVHENQTGKKRMYVEKDEYGKSVFTVEDLALNHYYKNGFANGRHCESSLITTILFVLFWDIIYHSPVKDAFISEIQYYPLDLRSEEFYFNRKEAIDKRLQEISSGWPRAQLEIFINSNWTDHSFEKSYINEQAIDEPEDLFHIILCIGRANLAKILERMIKDFKNYHAGLPDLFLWNAKQRKCKFVEVKGEKDKLSVKQKLWLDFLLNIGVDAEVCYVQTIGSKSKSRKSVKKEEHLK